MIKNVIVTDEFGNKQGLTYPKRAKGLIKQGRAEFVGENEIRLFYKQNNLLSSLINMEDDIMSEFDNFDNKENAEKTVNKLYFNAREWSFNPDCATNKGERTFVTDFEDNLIESYTVGDNSANTTEIMTKQLVLKKNTEYVFTFWIKQTSFKKFDTTCQLQILYNNDYENKRVYILNKNHIKHVKHYKGWKLFEIPFITEENEYTQMRFVVKSNVCTIIPAKDLEAYEHIPNQEEKTNFYEDAFGGMPTFDDMGKNVADKFNSIGDFAKEVSNNVKKDLNIQSIKDDIIKEIRKNFKL